MKTVYIERNKLFKNIPMILLNNITEVDEAFVEDNFNLFSYDCSNCNGTGSLEGKNGEMIDCDECYGNGTHDSEPYQYFLADMNDLDKERFNEFGVPVGYSNKLEKHIIPIYDFGTSWSAFSYSKEVDDDYTLAHDETETRTTVY